MSDLMPDGRQGPQGRQNPENETVNSSATQGKLTPGKVNDLYKAALRYQRRANQEYWMNHAFLTGHQWLWWDPGTKSIAELPRDEDRVQATINRLAHSTRSIMSKYTQRELVFEVLPDEASDAAMTGAKVAESVIYGIAKAHNWESKREAAGLAAWKGGTSGVCVDWNASAGKKLYDSGLDEGTGDEIPAGFEGDSVETVLSIAEIALQPGVKDGERGTWWIKAQVLPPEDVKAMFNLTEMPPADATAGLTPFASKLLASHAASSADEERPDLTLVLTYYERPNPKTPKGQVAIVVNNRFIEGTPKDWPFPWEDRLNIFLHRETLDENRSMGETILSQARSAQVALNAVWSNYLEHLKNAGNARLLIDAANLDILEHLSDTPGEFVPWQSGTEKPEWLQPAPLPDWIIRLLEELRQEIDDMLGVHDVSRGQAPVNIESGYGLSVLAEQDNSPVGRMVKDSAFMWASVATAVLLLHEQMTMTTRTTTIQQDQYGPKTIDWDGGTFAGQTDVTIPIDGVLPRSRAAQMAVAEKFVQMGLITDLETAALMAELPGQKDIIAAVNPDLYRARKENYEMSRGKPAIVLPIDNHQIHITAHEADIKLTYESDPSPEKWQIKFNHIQQHITMAAEQAGQAQAQASVSPMLAAAPGPSGQPNIPPEALPPGSLVDAAGADANGAPAPNPYGNMGEGVDPAAIMNGQAAPGQDPDMLLDKQTPPGLLKETPLPGQPGAPGMIPNTPPTG